MKRFAVAPGLIMAAMGSFIAWAAITYIHDGDSAGAIAGIGILALCFGLPLAWAYSGRSR